jgi:glycosyltransferase involved in cell wall biosynthesis
VVEDINKLPLYLPSLTNLPIYVIVPHLFGTTAFREAPWPMALTVWLAERPIPRVYRRAAFHAISQSTGDDLKERGVAAENIRVIYPGVDTGRYRPDRSTPRAAQPTFLYVGRIKRYKGIEIAIRAVAAASARGCLVRLIVAGQGGDRPRLERLASALGVAPSVRFLGFVSEERKLALLREAWAVVFPSPKEGWGITNLEAAACGTPAIASDSPGLRESVRHDQTGILVPHNDAEGLASAMCRVVEDRDLVERLGVAALTFAESLSWETTAEETAAHLEETVRAGTRGLPM